MKIDHDISNGLTIFLNLLFAFFDDGGWQDAR